MSKAKSFSDFTYGVGLEINATSFKQVKDDLKLNLDNLSKLVKSYGKILKIDPNADLSQLYNEIKNIQSVVDGINRSDNSFADFVDKGVLSRIADLEKGLTSVASISNEVQAKLSGFTAGFSAMTESLKASGEIKFPATFQNLFGNVQDQTTQIKTLHDQIQNLDSAAHKLNASLTSLKSSYDGKLDKATDVAQVKAWLDEFNQLKATLSKKIDANQLVDTLTKLSDLSQKLNMARNTFSDSDLAGLSTQFNQFDSFSSTLTKKFNSLLSQITKKREELSAEYKKIEAEQAEFTAKTQMQTGSKSLGLQSDYTAQVKILPKANGSEWMKKINDTLTEIEPKLNKVHLTPTFSHNSKSIEKEISDSVAQINHAIKVDLQITDDLSEENFNEKIKSLDNKIAYAKKEIEEKTKFKIRFDYEEGGRFKDAAYKVINHFKNIEATFYIKNSKKFLKDVAGLRMAAVKEFENTTVDITLGNQDTVLAEVDALRTKIDQKLNNIGVNLFVKNSPDFMSQINGIVSAANLDSNIKNAATEMENLSDAAKKANDTLANSKSALASLTSEKFDSPYFLQLGDINDKGKQVKGSTEKLQKMLAEFKSLQAKLQSHQKEEWFQIYPEANGNLKTLNKLINKDQTRLKQLEAELEGYYQKQVAYAQNRIEAAEKVLAAEQKIVDTSQKSNDKTQSSKTTKANQQLAMSAEEASKKQKKLNSELGRAQSILKSLDKQGIDSSHFAKISALYKQSDSFKKDQKKLQSMIDERNQLQETRAKHDVKAASKKESNLASKILLEQKKYISEIIAKKQSELKVVEDILAAETQVAEVKKEQSNIKTKDTSGSKTNQQLAASAEEATKKVRSLTGTLTHNNRVLKELQDSASWKNSSQFVKLGEWDKETQSFKKNSKEIQAMIDRYNKLRDARIKAGGANKVVSGEEASLRSKLSSIFVQQKKHMAEIVSKNQEELAAAKQVAAAYKEAGNSKQKVAKTKVDIDAATASKEVDEFTSKLNKAQEIFKTLKSQKFDALGSTGLGDVKGRLSGSGQSLDQLIKKYHTLIAKRNELEKSGMDISHPQYVAYAKEYQSVEHQLNTIYKDQVAYTRSRINYYKEQIAKAQQLLQLETKQTQEEAKQANINASKKTDAAATSTTAATTTAAPIKIDSASLNTLAKDATLKSIDGKINSILSQLNNGIQITGSNISITASNVSVSGATSGSVPNNNITGVNPLNANQQIVAGAKDATAAQKDLNNELNKTQQITDGLASSVTVVSELTGKIHRATDTYKTPDKVLEATEISSWVSHGKDEPKTFEHVSTVYKTNMEAFNKLKQNYINSLAKQLELEQQIANTNGPTSKLQEDLKYQQQITNNLEAQLNSHAQLYTEQLKQAAITEAVQKAQHEVARSQGAQSDKAINKQNNELLKIVDAAQSKLKDMQFSMQNSKVPMADAAIAKFSEYEQLLTTLKRKQQEIVANPNLLNDKTYRAGFESLLQQMKKVQTEFTTLQKSSEGFLSKIRSIDDIKTLSSTFSADNLTQLHAAMQEFANQAGNGTAKLIEFNDAERTATFEIQNGKNQMQQLVVAYDAGTNSLGRFVSKTTTSTSELQRFINSLKHSFQNVARYVASFGSVYRLFAMIRQGVTYVKEIDSALTELKKVTDETSESYSQFLQDMSKTGSVIGATVADLTTMAAEWARLKYLGLLYGDI